MHSLTEGCLTTDFRALCADLLAWSERTSSHYIAPPEVITHAREALSEPGPTAPTSEELMELMPESMRDEFSYAAETCSKAIGGQVGPGIFRVALNTAALEYAEAILARYCP